MYIYDMCINRILNSPLKLYCIMERYITLYNLNGRLKTNRKGSVELYLLEILNYREYIANIERRQI